MKKDIEIGLFMLCLCLHPVCLVLKALASLLSLLNHSPCILARVHKKMFAGWRAFIYVVDSG